MSMFTHLSFSCFLFFVDVVVYNSLYMVKDILI